jgi:hypothetical protein
MSDPQKRIQCTIKAPICEENVVIRGSKYQDSLPLTAALAMNKANANVPDNLGIPYFSRADVSSTPSGNTLVIGYFVPFAVSSLVDIKGRDCASQPFP